MALGTGMRLGEILAVRWKDVDLERRVLRVTATLSFATGREFTFPAPKTSRARRSVDLPEFVVAFLRRQRRAQLERRLFYGETWTDYDVVLDDVAGAPFAPWGVLSAAGAALAGAALLGMALADAPGWWWTDALAAVVIAAVLAVEGWGTLRRAASQAYGS